MFWFAIYLIIGASMFGLAVWSAKTGTSSESRHHLDMLETNGLFLMTICLLAWPLVIAGVIVLYQKGKS